MESSSEERETKIEWSKYAFNVTQQAQVPLHPCCCSAAIGPSPSLHV
jgi:hypothetical protein